MSDEDKRRQAMEIYELDRILTNEERIELSRMHSALISQSVSAIATGFIVGVAVPFITRKKGKVLSPMVPIASGIVGASTSMMIEPFFFVRKIKELQDSHPPESNITKMMKLSTDVNRATPIAWAPYFQRSSENPNFRIKDPRTVTDSPILIQLDVERIKAHFKDDPRLSQQQQQPQRGLQRHSSSTYPRDQRSSSVQSYNEDDNSNSPPDDLSEPSAGQESPYTSRSSWDALRDQEKREALQKYQGQTNNSGYSSSSYTSSPSTYSSSYSNSPSTYQYPPPQGNPDLSKGDDIFEVSFDDSGDSSQQSNNLPNGTGPGTAWDKIRRGGR